jgi:hypothetical protein
MDCGLDIDPSDNSGDDNPVVDAPMSRPLRLKEGVHSGLMKLWLALKIWQSATRTSLTALASLLAILSVFLTALLSLANIQSIFSSGSSNVDSSNAESSSTTSVQTCNNGHIAPTLHTFHKSLGLHADNDADFFTIFSMCRKCSSIYTEQDVVRQGIIRSCSHQPFPNHPQMAHRASCGAELGAFDAQGQYRPHCAYPYSSLIARLSNLFAQKDFEDLIEQWRKRTIIDNCYADIYDGRTWSNFQNVDGVPFLSEPGNLAFMLNIGLRVQH